MTRIEAPRVPEHGPEEVSGRGIAARVNRLQLVLAKPVDIAWLAAFRVTFGIVMFVSMLRFLAYGWVTRFFANPQFFFKYWGFSWVEPLPEPAMQALFAALAACALAIALGVAFRVTALFFAIGLSYVQLIDVSTYLNHYYLASLLAWILAFSPAHRAYSIDAWRGGWNERRVAAGWLYLWRVQVGLVYFFAGMAKAQSDWLVHAQPLRIWLGANTELPILGPLLLLDGVPTVLSWCGFLFDSTIVLWLSLRRTRLLAFMVVIVFHVLTRVLFPIGMFPVIMVTSALVFFEADWPRQLVRRAPLLSAARARLRSLSWPTHAVPVAASARAAGTSAAGGVAERTSSSLAQRWGWALAMGYCLVQLLLPLRFLAYGGNVLWHEQGMRFSWRVMVRAKGGSTRFVVENPATGQIWQVDPDAYLTPMQESEMASQPDLILQLAHHIKRDFEARGLGPVQVRALARASLNGRRSAPLIDPDVDLGGVRDGLGLAQFILPAPEDVPPHTRLVP